MPLGHAITLEVDAQKAIGIDMDILFLQESRKTKRYQKSSFKC